jgi:hypothetical protein
MKEYKIVTHSKQLHEYTVKAESMDEAKYKIRNGFTEGVEYIRTDSNPTTCDTIVHENCEEINNNTN